jgi:putative transposase
MARLARLHAPGIVQRVVQRSAAGRVLFDDEADYRFAVDLLAGTARANGVALHAYALLPDQLVMLATPSTGASLPSLMQAIGRRLAPYRNRKSRYRSTLIDADQYLFDCMRQIETAPVDAGLACSAAEWRWSSHRHHVGLETSPIVTDHALYWGLRNTPFERQAAYAALAEAPLGTGLVATIVEATEKGWALGGDDFLRALESESTRRLRPLARGRPKKASTTG